MSLEQFGCSWSDDKSCNRLSRKGPLIAADEWMRASVPKRLQA